MKLKVDWACKPQSSNYKIRSLFNSVWIGFFNWQYSIYLELNQIVVTAKQYKVEARTYYSKLTTNKQHIIESSVPEIQSIMDEYAADGWTLVSTDASNFGAALYIYLYFEKE